MKKYFLMLVLASCAVSLNATRKNRFITVLVDSTNNEAHKNSTDLPINTFDEAAQYISENGSYNHPCSNLWLKLAGQKAAFEAAMFAKILNNKLLIADKEQLKKEHQEYLKQVTDKLKACILHTQKNK